MIQEQILFTNFSKEDLKALFMECLISFCEVHQSFFNEKSFTEKPIDSVAAAAVLNLQLPTLYALVSKIPHYKQAKKLYFFESELVEWIKANRVPTILDRKEEVSKFFSQSNRSRRKNFNN